MVTGPPSGPAARALGGLAFAWVLRRTLNSREQLDAEHPKFIAVDVRVDRPLQVARQVAAEISDDADAVAAVRARAGGRPKDWKIAAAWLRETPYSWEHRTELRAAHLLKAAADGGLPVSPTAEQEALFRRWKVWRLFRRKKHSLRWRRRFPGCGRLSARSWLRAISEHGLTGTLTNE